MYETVRIETDARGVATLWLARPEKHNAMSAQMLEELAAAAEALAADETVRAVVLAAEGKSFCAGGDLGWMQEQMAATAEERAAGARRLAEMLGALDTLPKPVIGRIQGQLIEVPNCGHNVHSQNTLGFLDAVGPFLESLS